MEKQMLYSFCLVMNLGFVLSEYVNSQATRFPMLTLGWAPSVTYR